MRELETEVEAEGFLKRLKLAQLKALLAALDRKQRAPCVPPPPLWNANEPHLVCARLWRWPDLGHQRELRPLPPPTCTQRHCCNPYHWSRRALSDEADEADGRLAECAGEWCRLAYWELGRRVGRAYGVAEAAVDVFNVHSPEQRGLCLLALPTRSSACARTRAKIGLGLTLSREADGVWAYNRSEQPLFVHSPGLRLLVYRVAPGHCLRVFASHSHTARPETPIPLGPPDLRSVRISFAKGWGPKYSRPDVTACPCWLQVILN